MRSCDNHLGREASPAAYDLAAALPANDDGVGTGKRNITEAVFGLRMPEKDRATLQIGRLIYWSNDLLGELVGDGFQTIQHASAFLWWAKDQPEDRDVGRVAGRWVVARWWPDGYVSPMTTQQLSSPDRQLPVPARAAVALENDDRLDPAVSTMTKVMAPLNDSPVGAALRGKWMGHALHPALTDLPLGLWTATSVLDVFGGHDARPAARRLLGIGLLAAAPTAASGWAEWTRAERPAQRVGVAHAVLNAAAAALYAGSWAARRGERHRLGAVLGAGGASLLGAAAYLGGHLTTVREVSSRHPAFDRTDLTDAAT